MIVSLRSISYEDLKNKLSKEDNIVLISCNTCVVACGIGGTQKLNLLQTMLSADGYHVLGTDLISIGCDVNLVAKHRTDLKKQEMYQHATVIIPLFCENGLESIFHVFHDKKVIPISKTLGTGNLTPDRGVVLTNPFEKTGLKNSVDGYTLSELAEKFELFDEFFDEFDAAEPEVEYVNLTIDGYPVIAKKGANLLQVCGENGLDIPHLCYNPELTEAGVCRLCLVKIKGFRELAPSCCTHVTEGMEVITEDEELIQNRKIILELIMSSHNHNCLTCQKGIPSPLDSCKLQELMRKYGIEKSRYDQNFEPDPIDDSSPLFTYDSNRCILCGQCVRACEEIAGQCNIGFINRGSQTIVAAGLNEQFDQSACAECMACVNACPTGALTDKYLKLSGSSFTATKVYPDYKG